LNSRMVIPVGMIGAVIGVAVGYAVASLTRLGTVSFAQWAGLNSEYHGSPGDALAWAIGGVVIGAAVGSLWRS
jgi:hypothetical protein